MALLSRLITGLFIPVAISVDLPRTIDEQDWPQWRGPNRDGKVDTSPSLNWPKRVEEQWAFRSVLAMTRRCRRGKIYVFARQGEEEVLLALDSATGKELWRSAQSIEYKMHEAAVAHGKGPKATPVVSKNNVCTFGISGVVSCHDARTGKLKWREASKQFPNTSPLFGAAMSPVLENGMLIVHLGGHDKGALTAFDAETGKVKWSNDVDGPAYASPIVVTLGEVRHLVNLTQKELIGVDLATGKLLWRMPAKSQYEENSVTAVSYKDMLIVSREEMGLSAFRIEKQDGQMVPREVWNTREAQLYMNSPVLQGNILFGMSAMKKGQFFALDADTGKTLWQSPGRMGENAAILNLDGKVFLSLTNDANLIVVPVEAKEYSPLIQYTVAKSPTWAHPAVIGNRILIKDETSLISYAMS